MVFSVVRFENDIEDTKCHVVDLWSGGKVFTVNHVVYQLLFLLVTDIRKRFKQMAANQFNFIRSVQFNWNWKISWKQSGWKINQYLTLLINGCLNKMTMHTNKVACLAYHPSNWIDSTRIEENLMWSNCTRQKDEKTRNGVNLNIV